MPACRFHRLGLILPVTFILACSPSETPNGASQFGLTARDAGVSADSLAATPAEALVDDVKSRFQYVDPKSLKQFDPYSAGPAYRSYLAPTDGTSFVASGAAVQKAHAQPSASASVVLPTTAAGLVTLTDRESGASISVGLRGTTPAAFEEARGYAVFRGAHRSGADEIHAITSSGDEDFLYFKSKPQPTSISYDLVLGSGIAGMRLVANTLEFLDAGGTPRLRAGNPVIVGADGKAAVPVLSMSGCNYDVSTAPPWNRAVTAPNASRCVVTVDWSDANITYPALLDPAWTSCQSMSVAIYGHAMTEFNGKVVVTGGYQAGVGSIATTQIYDPTTGTWSVIGSMQQARYMHSATYLPAQNSILVAGGAYYTISTGQWGNVTTSEKLVNNSWPSSSVASMATPTTARYGHSQALFATTARVIVAGGDDYLGNPLSTAQLYDPTSNVWITGSGAAPDMGHTRYQAAAVLINGGSQFLITGGQGNGPATAEYYNPATNGWTSTTNVMTAERYWHNAILLPDGRVLIAGGRQSNGTINSSTEIFSFNGSPQFTSAGNLPSSPLGRFQAAGILFPNGTAMIAGGDYYSGGWVDYYDTQMWSSEVAAQSPTGNGWYVGPQMNHNRDSGAIAMMPLSGSKSAAFIAGGWTAAGNVAASEYLALDGSCTHNSDCSSLQCVTGTCSAALCSVNTDCTAGNYCAMGSCAPLVVAGSACGTTSSVCASGLSCVNGVCCTTSSCPACARCDISSDGSCAAVPAGTAGSPACSGNTICDGISQSCGGICTSDSMCAAGAYCIPGTGCSTKKATGASCSAADQCASGFCAQGYCCNTLCDNGTSCEACNVAGALGTCTVVTTGSCAALQLPPEPTAVYGQSASGVATSFMDSTAFLYSQTNSANLIQKGTINNTSVIAPDRAAVVRGRVLSQGLSLPGATISILNHSEYGTTVSRTDGRYDMAVNGGAILTVVVQAQGFATVERQIFVPANTYAAVSDVSLLPYPTATAINLADGNPHYVLGPNVVENGVTRNTNVLFLSGTTATLNFSDNTTQPLTTLTLHAPLEMTQTTDDSAMPGTLPQSSAYTFAAEFGVDEVLSRQNQTPAATGVSFSGNLPIAFVDNFLSFPVGTTAPLGGFDLTVGLWQAAPSGKVVNLCSISGGAVQVDTTGAGCTNPDNTGMGLTERQQLALMYPSVSTSAKKLWRVQVPHFSSWDINWGFFPPALAQYPNVPPPSVPSKLDDPCTAAGSIIECDNQILGQRIPIVGTDFTLNYRTDRQPGWASDRSITVPLVGSTVPPNLAQVWLQVSVAGQIYLNHYPATANTTTTYTWDGNDPYGRPVWGPAAATVRVGYEYIGTYAKTEVFGYNGGGTITSAPTTRQRLILWGTSVTLPLRQWDARSIGLGGWTLDVHHVLDVASQTLYRGDGGRRSAGSAINVISTVAGGVSGGVGGENVPAVGAPLNYPSGVVISPDGTIFVADTNNGRVRKIANGLASTYATVSGALYLALAADGTLYVSSGVSQLTVYRVKTDGTVSLFAGNGQRYTYDPNTAAQGDGGPATAALFNQITGLACGADGSVYIADGNRVRRVGTDGNIVTVAGTKSSNVNSAMELGGVEGVAAAADGNVYIRHDGSIGYEITQLTASGILNHIAGGGNDGATHCKILPAATSSIHVGYSIAIGNDGSIYFDQDYGVMRIGPDGVVTTAAGSCSQSGTYSGDGGPAVGPTIRAVGQGGITLDSTGTKLYITDNGFGGPQGVRLVTVANRQYKVPSDDGSEIYVFDLYGRHQSTIDGKTGGTKYSFGYDSNGLLSSVTTFGSRTTLITQGAAISIQGPFGHLTTLGLDPTTHFLSYITDPNSEEVSFGTDANGLMMNLTDAKQQQHVFAYDAVGKLIRDENPAAGVQTLARSTSLTPGPGLTETVTKTTKLGRTTTYSVEHSGQTQNRTVTMPTGLSSMLTVGTDGTRDWQFADGTTTHKALLTDPRFALTAPAVKDYKVVSSGVTFEAQTTSRTATCGAAGTCTSGVTCDGTNLTNLINQTDAITINGKSFSAAYVQTCPSGNGGTYTITNTTPGTTSQRYRKLTLDPLGRVVQSEIGGVYPLRFHYDSLGRVDQIAQGTQGGADERIVTRTFNPYSPPTTQGSGSGFPATETFNDLASDYVQFANYDAAGRTRSITLPGATSPIAVAYDLNGNVSSLTPPGGSAHSFTYDGVDRLANYSPAAIGSPAGATPTRELYDPDQNPVEVGRPDGDSVFVGYDPFGRVSTVTHSLTSFTYAYDSSGRVSQIQTNGSAFGENLQYGYGTAGSTALDFIRTGAVSGTVHRDLNPFFQPSNETINGANAVSFSYDDDGLLITAGAQQLRADTLSGLLTGTTVGCITDSYSYLHTGQTLSFGEVATYTASSASCSSNQNSSLVSITYDTAANPRDKRGRVVQKQETFNGISHSFVYAYDAANHLQSVQRDGTTVESYTYDANGNRLTATNTLNGSSQIGLNPPTYDAQDRLITYPQPAPAGTVNAINYSYTLAGERSVKYVQADWFNHVPPIYNHKYTYYTYDAFGNLVTVILPSGDRIDYIIDGENRRVGKRVNGNLVQGFLYGTALGPVAELNPDGSVRSRFVYGTKPNVPDYMIQGTSTYRIITDQVGSVRLVVDTATGAVVQQLDYDAFGNVISATPAYPTLSAAIQPFGFAGGLYDADTNLVRFGARDYDPEVGRWLTKDPLRFTGGDTNLYSYCGADPVNRVDRDGLKPGELYSSIEDAATAALDEAAAMTNANGVEYAGRIIETDDGQFTYARPRKGSKYKSTPPPKTPQCVASYHTHPDDLEDFSKADLNAIKHEKLPEFLEIAGTGMIKVYRPGTIEPLQILRQRR